MATHPDGDTFDLETIYRRYHVTVAWLVRGHVPEHAVDDVVQDVFIAIHRRLPRAPRDESLGRWVLGAARSVCHSYRRGDARRRARAERSKNPEPETCAEA